MARPGESSDRMFLTVVLEFSQSSEGEVLNALHEERLTALRLPHLSHLRIAYEQMRPRVLVVDSDMPGGDEIAVMRTMRAKDRSGSLSIALLGTATEEELPVEISELVDAYIRKPVDWKKVARAVVAMVNNRRPPSGVVLLRQA